MLLRYQDASEYANVVLPILEEEWYTYSKTFRADYKTQGSMVSCKFIEQTEMQVKGKMRTRDIFALTVEVRSSKFWNPGTIGAIKKADVTLDVEIESVNSIQHFFSNLLRHHF